MMILMNDVTEDQEIPNLPTGNGRRIMRKNDVKVRASLGKKNFNQPLNSVLCGCLALNSDRHASKDIPLTVTNTQLLPSSAVQSMKDRIPSPKDDPDSYDDENHTQESTATLGTQENAKLPSSQLFPSSLLVSLKHRCSVVSEPCTTNHDKSTRLSWKNWRLLRWGRSKSRAESSLGNKHLAGGDQLSSVVEEQPEIDESVVFSPLSGQVVPEVINSEHHNALLGPRQEGDRGKKCFVIDLDETLVHSSFKMVEHADFKVGVEIDGITHRVYVLKRPHVDVFLATMANLYECVLFTASLAKYADPVADFIDRWNAFRYRLFRESCVYHRGNYVKDLSHLGRPINQIVILDNSPASYLFHANHAVQISSWFDDTNDRALLDLIPYFERLASHPNVVDFLRTNAPPTPCAAVGSVGLSTGILPSGILPTPSMVGHSADTNAIISSIRRPAVASPLPLSVSESRTTTNNGRPVTTTTFAQADSRKNHSLVSSNLVSSNALPVITKMAAPSSGPTVNRLTPTNAGAVSFPAPLSLASSLPVPQAPTPTVTTWSFTTGSTSQARVPGRTTNSHNVPSEVIDIPNVDLLDNSRLSKLPVSCNPNPAIVHGLSGGITTVPSSTTVVLTTPATAPCISSGENEYSYPSTPRKLGTVRSILNDTPVQTLSPPLYVGEPSTANRRFVP